jgi:hypothetical protein
MYNASNFNALSVKSICADNWMGKEEQESTHTKYNEMVWRRKVHNFEVQIQEILVQVQGKVQEIHLCRQQNGKGVTRKYTCTKYNVMEWWRKVHNFEVQIQKILVQVQGQVQEIDLCR